MLYNWLSLALLAAFFESCKNVSSKIGLREGDEYVVSWGTRFLALPVLLPVLLWEGVPPLGPNFWPALLVGGSFNLFNLILFMYAIRKGELSQTAPLLSITPISLLVTGPLILGEWPSRAELGGILLVAAGTYVLNIEGGMRNLAAPLRELWRAPGARAMLLVAVLVGITAPLDKVGVQNSSPVFWSVAVNVFLSAALLPFLAFKSKKPVAQMRANFLHLLLGGAFNGVGLLCQMGAVVLTPVANVIAVKRLSAIFNVIFGAWFFRERHFGWRFWGASIMTAGALALSWAAEIEAWALGLLDAMNF